MTPYCYECLKDFLIAGYKEENNLHIKSILQEFPACILLITLKKNLFCA